MITSQSTQSSVIPSRSQTASSISDPSEKDPTASSIDRPLRKSHSSDKKFSLDGYNGQVELEGVQDGDETPGDSPGTLPDAVYYAQMPRWRAVVRRQLVKSLKYESKILGIIQRHVRTRWLDTYFLYSSALGSHTFFMSALPALFYFGHGEIGRGLLQIMCMGVFVSSFMKDLFCSPRPFTTHVSRLSIGTHHLEYGFPSTHSTNCMSFAVYLYILLQSDASNSHSAFATPAAYYSAVSILVWYAGSIVLGRLYCGMHSFVDCIAGSLLGASIGLIQGVYGPWFEEFVAGASWTLPVSVSLLCLLLTNQHPQPVDDCPCFEDAIASLALLTGTVISRWHASQSGMDVPSGFYISRTPGWENITLGDTLVWWLFAVLKMVTGVSAIFAWRLIVKQIMHTVLPPLFRWASGFAGNIGWQLPARRWYTPATEYESVPGDGLHPIPSSMNLTAELSQRAGFGVFGDDETDEDNAHTTGRLPHAHRFTNGERTVKWRGTAADSQGSVGLKRVVVQEYVDSKGEKLDVFEESDDGEDDEDEDGERENGIKHYDADVLTKVIVYSGIGAIATYLTPVTFELLGWGVQPVI